MGRPQMTNDRAAKKAKSEKPNAYLKKTMKNTWEKKKTGGRTEDVVHVEIPTPPILHREKFPDLFVQDATCSDGMNSGCSKQIVKNSSQNLQNQMLSEGKQQSSRGRKVSTKRKVGVSTILQPYEEFSKLEAAGQEEEVLTKLSQFKGPLKTTHKHW